VSLQFWNFDVRNIRFHFQKYNGRACLHKDRSTVCVRFYATAGVDKPMKDLRIADGRGVIEYIGALPVPHVDIKSKLIRVIDKIIYEIESIPVDSLHEDRWTVDSCTDIGTFLEKELKRIHATA